MISRLELKNYRCFQDAEISLSPFSVIVGQNSAGKTAFINALLQLSRFPNHYLFAPECWAGQKPEQLRCYWVSKDSPIVIDCKFRSTPTSSDNYRFLVQLSAAEDKLNIENAGLEITEEQFHTPLSIAFERKNRDDLSVVLPDGQQPVSFGDKGRNPLFFHALNNESWLSENLSGAKDIKDRVLFACNYLQRIRNFDFRPESISSWGVPKATSLSDLTADGSNLMEILEYIQEAENDVFESINKELRRVVPNCMGITFDRDLVSKFEYANEEEGPFRTRKFVQETLMKRLAYRFERDGKNILLPSNAVSSGLLLFTAFITLARVSYRPSVLIVEEPERGVHPGRLKEIVTWLRTMTESSPGRSGTQVILTTHSPYLLDCCKPEEVLIFHRPEGAGTRVQQMSKVKNVNKLLAQLQPGELWTALTEEKLVSSKV